VRTATAAAAASKEDTRAATWIARTATSARTGVTAAATRATGRPRTAAAAALSEKHSSSQSRGDNSSVNSGAPCRGGTVSATRSRVSGTVTAGCKGWTGAQQKFHGEHQARQCQSCEKSLAISRANKRNTPAIERR
jgi:hypothetical protein